MSTYGPVKALTVKQDSVISSISNVANVAIMSLKILRRAELARWEPTVSALHLRIAVYEYLRVCTVTLEGCNVIVVVATAATSIKGSVDSYKCWL